MWVSTTLRGGQTGHIFHNRVVAGRDFLSMDQERQLTYTSSVSAIVSWLERACWKIIAITYHSEKGPRQYMVQQQTCPVSPTAGTELQLSSRGRTKASPIAQARRTTEPGRTKMWKPCRVMGAKKEGPKTISITQNRNTNNVTQMPK
jgi:hypothetical protein